MIYQTDYIEEINSLFEKRNSLLPFSKEDETKLRKKYRLEFNYNSNHIEGNTLTYGQTQLLLMFDKSTGDVPMSDLEEMKAHDVALKMIHEMAQDHERPLTEQFIKELNKLILVRNFWKEAITIDGIATRKEIIPGEYKSSPNSVRLRNGEIHEYASPEETPAKMNDLMDWYRANENEMHPVQLAAEFHYRFVCIHPFDDGNGRIARLIMNYILLRFNYPIIIIKSKDKENYLTALQKADVGDKQAIIEYLEKQMLWSLELELKAANGVDLEEDDDIDKEIELLRRENSIVNDVYKSKSAMIGIVDSFSKDTWPILVKSITKFSDFFKEQLLIVKVYTIGKDGSQDPELGFVKYDNFESIKELSLKIKEHRNISTLLRINIQFELNKLKTVKEDSSVILEFSIVFKELFTLTRINITAGKIIGLPFEYPLIKKKYAETFSTNEIRILQKEISKQLLKIIKNND